jgi:hypothetical protein
MANSTYGIDEIRLNVADPDRTDVYIYLSAGVDCPHFVVGWHYKAYPARMTTAEVFSLLGTTPDHDPLCWVRKAPPDVVSSEAGQLALALLTWDMGMDPSKPGWSYWEGLRMLAESVIGDRPRR